MREGRHEVEEVGLVQALQEVVELSIHSFQEPGGHSSKTADEGVVTGQTWNLRSGSHLPIVVESVLYWRKLLMPLMVAASMW